MAPGPATRSTPRLMSDLAHQIRQLLAAEFALFQAELGEISSALGSASRARRGGGAGAVARGPAHSAGRHRFLADAPRAAG